MSGTLKVSGIVVRETKTKESDKIITVLTRQQGIIRIYVKGAMRLKNRFHSATGLFTYSDFVLFESRSSDLYQLNEASVKHTFYALSLDVEYLSLAMYMAELVCAVNVPDDMNNEILRLFLNILHMMCRGKWDVLLCKAAFEMRLMCDVGFRPNLVGCKRCYAYEAEMFFFDAENGEIACNECWKSYDAGSLTCEMTTLTAMRYFAYADLEQMFSFNITDKHYINQLSGICEEYVKWHIKEKFSTLDFFNNLISGGKNS